MTEKNLELAYEAAKLALSQQDGTLGKVRDRATAILSAASVAVSFSAGVGLVAADGKLTRQFPLWGALALVGTLVAMVVTVSVILWPVPFSFGPDPIRIIALHDEGTDEDGIRREIVDKMIGGMRKNVLTIIEKQKFLRIEVSLLLLELTLIILVAAMG